MIIKKIKGESFMRLRVIDCAFDKQSGIIEVTGKNGAGKSSLLKIIESLAGKSAMPSQPLNSDAKKGSVEIHLGDESVKYIATWSMTENDSYLKLEAADGAKIAGPQKVLSAFLGALLDPWAFVQLATGTAANRRQACDLLRDLIRFPESFSVRDAVLKPVLKSAFPGDDGSAAASNLESLVTEHRNNPFAFIDALENRWAERAKDCNRDAKRIEGTLQTLKSSVPPEERDVQPVDVSDLSDYRDQLRAALDHRDRLESVMFTKANRVAELKAELETAQAELAAAKEALEAEPGYSSDDARFKSETVEQEIETVTEKLRNATEHNRKAASAVQIREQEKALEEESGRADLYKGLVASLREHRKKLFEEYNPVPGMEIIDGNLYLAGQPFDQASKAEQLRASVGIAVSMNPELKVCVCNDASLLDKESMRILEECAEQHGFQFFLELVADEEKPGVLFVEDGVALTKS